MFKIVLDDQEASLDAFENKIVEKTREKTCHEVFEMLTTVTDESGKLIFEENIELLWCLESAFLMKFPENEGETSGTTADNIQ